MSSITDPDQAIAGRGKRWGYLGAAVGGVVSVAANVAHSFVPAQAAGVGDAAWRLLPDAHPRAGAVLLAAFWPCALLLAIEVLARVDWPRQRRWTLLRWGGVTPVAVVAAVVSYLHLSGLLHWYGEDGLTVTIGPAAVDGLMVISTGALLALASHSLGSSARSSESVETVESSEPDEVTPDEVTPDEVTPNEPGERVASGDIPSESSESSRSVVVSIGSHRPSPGASQPSEPGARPGDVERLREAISRGDVDQPLKIARVMEALHIGAQYARAAVAHVEAERAEA